MERAARIAAHLLPASEAQIPELGAQPTAAPGDGYVVAVLGASGGIGQPLSLLLKLTPGVRELRLYDVAPTAGVAADLSHIATPARVSAHTGPTALADALYGVHLVVIPAGVPRKPGMTRDDLFNINAGIVRTLVEGVARFCPRAWLAIISNPVNSTVPIAAEVLKRAGAFNPGRLFGVTTLDVLRANTFAGEVLGLDPETVSVPVIGGHAGATILPVLSAASPPVQLPEDRARALMARIQDAGTEVVKAKAGAGSATLSMAAAAARFAASCLRAMGGDSNVVECAYVASSLVSGLPYLASPLRLGPSGIAEFLPLPRMSALERENFEAMQAELAASIQKGVDFVANPPPAKNRVPTKPQASRHRPPSTTEPPIMAPTATEVGELLKPLLLKDLRIQCRARGLNPGGSREALLERVCDHMLETGNLELAAEFNGEVAIGVPQPKAAPGPDGPIGVANNNYVRDQGQNVGNFITDRPSSRVLAPPGGVTSWSLGGDVLPPAPKPRPAAGPASHPVELTAVATAEAVPAAPAPDSEGAAVIGGEGGVGHNNNYSRPQGQNVGNFITDKPSSRVLAPPGGGSSIVFG